MVNSEGKLTAIYVGAQKGAAKSPAANAELIAGHGLSGDRHAGVDPRRQVSLIAHEVLRELAAEGLHYSAGELNANLLVEGIALDSLKPGARLRLAGVEIEIVEARQPCGVLTRLDRRLPKKLYRRCGQLGRVLTSGIIHPGAVVEVINPQPEICFEVSLVQP